MKLVRWSPAYDVFREMDRFFEDFNRQVGSLDTTRPFATPALDIVDHDDRLELHVDLPGFAPEDVDIEFRNGALYISAEVNRDESKEEGNYTRRERYHGAYKRVLRIPEVYDAEKANAHFENGVLVLSLPKKPEAQPLRIAVNTKPALTSGK